MKTKAFLTVVTVLALQLSSLPLIPQPTEAAADVADALWFHTETESVLTTPDVCYSVADSKDGVGDDDRLVMVDRLTGAFTDIGDTGTLRIEAITFDLTGTTVFAADRDQVGTLNLSTGAFTALPSTVGTMDGALGTMPEAGDQIDVDGMSFDPMTGIMYGVHRRESPSPSTEEDLLFQIEPTTGAHVPDAFGPGIDYVVINSGTLGLYDIDGLAFDPSDGQLYAIANATATAFSINDRLVRIDKATGSVTDVGRLTVSGGGNVDDMEGLSSFSEAMFYGTTGDSLGSANDNSMWMIDKSTAEVTLVTAFPLYGDYESLTCLTGSIGDYVWLDADGDGKQDASEDGIADITVNLYEDQDGDGVVDPEDNLIAATATDDNGNYTFTGLASGSYIVDVDENDPDLPDGVALTTDNDPMSVALASDYNDADFGFGSSGPTAVTLSLFIAKSAGAVPASQGTSSAWPGLGLGGIAVLAVGGLIGRQRRRRGKIGERLSQGVLLRGPLKEDQLMTTVDERSRFNNHSRSDKGKPVARRGRKATDPSEHGRAGAREHR